MCLVNLAGCGCAPPVENVGANYLQPRIALRRFRLVPRLNSKGRQVQEGEKAVLLQGEGFLSTGTNSFLHIRFHFHLACDDTVRSNRSSTKLQ